MLGGDDDTLRARLLSRTRLRLAQLAGAPERQRALSRQAIEIAEGSTTLRPSLHADRAVLGDVVAGEPGGAAGDRRGDRSRSPSRSARASASPMRTSWPFLELTELGRIHEARLALDDPRAGDRGARQPAQVWLAPVNRSMLGPARWGLRGCGGVGGQRGPVDYWITPGRDEVSAAMHRFLLRREQGRVAEEEACGPCL